MNDTLIARATAPGQTITAAISEKKFFASMTHLFTTSFTFLAEAMQNARRAGASRVEFHCEPERRRLTIFDDGHGIENFQDLVHLCESGWHDDVAQEDRPFGMGLFSLFAAGEAVTISSRGQSVTITMADIQERKPITVHSANEGALGTHIVIHGLAQRVCETNQHYTPYAYQGKGEPPKEWQTHACFQQLQAFANGFAIPVFYNGVECQRPHAQSELQGVQTEVGFFSMQCVHHTLPSGPTVAHFTGATTLYLQGLPIGNIPGSGYRSTGTNICHLDNARFQPRMPDRAALKDAEDAHKQILRAAKALLVQHLTELKARLSPQQFVQHYAAACIEFECPTLLNDLDFVPANWFQSIDQVHTRGDYTSVCSGNVIARADIESGKFAAWRHAPITSDSYPGDAVVLKAMQRLDIRVLKQDRIRDHWLWEIIPSAHDIRIRVTTKAEQPRSIEQDLSGDHFGSITIHMVDSIELELTSVIDAAYRRCVQLDNDWVLVPEGYAGDPWTDFTPIADTPLMGECYVTASDHTYHGHPVVAIADFMDEYDSWDEDAEQRAIASWDAVVSGLRGDSLATVVADALGGAPQNPSACHEQQLAIVRTVRREYQGAVHGHAFRAVDASSEAFWQKVAALVQEQGAAGTLAERIKHAMHSAASSQELNA